MFHLPVCHASCSGQESSVRCDDQVDSPSGCCQRISGNRLMWIASYLLLALDFFLSCLNYGCNPVLIDRGIKRPSVLPNFYNQISKIYPPRNNNGIAAAYHGSVENYTLSSGKPVNKRRRIRWDRFWILILRSSVLLCKNSAKKQKDQYVYHHKTFVRQSKFLFNRHF